MGELDDVTYSWINLDKTATIKAPVLQTAWEQKTHGCLFQSPEKLQGEFHYLEDHKIWIHYWSFHHSAENHTRELKQQQQQKHDTEPAA